MIIYIIVVVKLNFCGFIGGFVVGEFIVFFCSEGEEFIVRI